LPPASGLDLLAPDALLGFHPLQGFLRNALNQCFHRLSSHDLFRTLPPTALPKEHARSPRPARPPEYQSASRIAALPKETGNPSWGFPPCRTSTRFQHCQRPWLIASPRRPTNITACLTPSLWALSIP
jgi:hypothetical protein